MFGSVIADWLTLLIIYYTLSSIMVLQAFILEVLTYDYRVFLV